MKQRYQSPAWISAALDDAGLTPHEFRVLAHVCRRAGDGSNGRGCDASVASMAAVCRMKADTVRQALKALVRGGWLTAWERSGKATSYFPACLGNPSYPSPETGAHPSPHTVGDPSRSRGDEGNPLRDTLKGTRTDTEFPAEGCGASPHPSDGNLGRVPARALERDGKLPEVSEDEARAWARKIHEIEGRGVDSTVGIFPPEEVEAWAVDWLVAMQARGWRLSDAPVVNPRAALRGYLRKAAAMRSKRFREFSRDGD